MCFDDHLQADWLQLVDSDVAFSYPNVTTVKHDVIQYASPRLSLDPKIFDEYYMIYKRLMNILAFPDF